MIGQLEERIRNYSVTQEHIDGTQKALYEKYKIDPALAIASEILKQ